MRALTAALVLGLLGVGCGPAFDPPSQLHSLRVLAVEKDVPYAQPGQKVNLELLWEDASEKALLADGTKRPVTIAWSGPCVDPDGDLYYGCFTDSTLFDATTVTLGEKALVTIPSDIISQKPPPTEARNAPYGVAFVFFAVCAGTLTPIPATAATSFPVGCKDDSGTLLGADDFVAGYVSVYSFLSFSNKNPVISGFKFNGQTLAADAFCVSGVGGVGDDCLSQAGSSTPSDIDCSDPKQADRCVPTCAGDGKASCHAYPIQPVLDQAPNQEQDEVSAALVGRHVGEQMWIDYYTDGGGFKSDVRLLNDATSGWNDSYGTDFYAPKDSKVSRVWAVVHDNRGGAAWAGITIKTQ